ncbi:MAG: outer membrane protein [Opitutales bacterium]|jgi:opacity protein-like surface antigen
MRNYRQSVLAIGSLLLGAVYLNAAYVGGSVGYMIDGEEEIFSVQVGFPVAESGKVTHNLEFEVGIISSSDEVEGMSVDADFNPLMVNYLFKTNPEKGVSFYAGGGIGWTLWDVDVMSYSFDGDVFTWQIMVGLQYSLSENAALKLGYRYLYLDDIEVEGYDFGDADDSVIELGVVFNF